MKYLFLTVVVLVGLVEFALRLLLCAATLGFLLWFTGLELLRPAVFDFARAVANDPR